MIAFFREHFGHKHPKYSDTLLDYGFYLLNVDNICQSVAIYQVGSVSFSAVTLLFLNRKSLLFINRILCARVVRLP